MSVILAEPHERALGLSDRESWILPGTATAHNTTMLTGRAEPVQQMRCFVPGGQLVIEAESELPPWFQPVAMALVQLLNLPPAWDSYGARPVVPAVVPTALQLLMHVMRDDSAPPAVVPTNRGGVQLEWHSNGIDLEIEIGASHRVLVSCQDDATGEEREFDASTNLTALGRLIGELSARGARP